jgi:ankyrin repeat protein
MGMSYAEKECVQLLLQHGADPNAIRPTDGDVLEPSILLYAAARQRWEICRMLIEAGADVAYKATSGESLQTYTEAEKPYYADDSSSAEDFEFVKKVAR